MAKQKSSVPASHKPTSRTKAATGDEYAEISEFLLRNPDGLNFSGNLTVEDVQRIEEKGDQFCVERRVVFLVLTKPSPQLMKWAEEHPDVFIEALDGIGKYKENLETLLQFTRAAQARMLLTGEATAAKEERAHRSEVSR